MNDINVTVEQKGNKGRSVAWGNSKQVGEMTFTKKNDRLVIEHTEVNEPIQGRGVGRDLLDALVEKARAEQILIEPLCTYAKHVFDEDPAIADVLYNNQKKIS